MKKDVCLIGEMFDANNEIEYYITSSRSLGIALLAACLRKHGFSVDIIDPLLHNYTVDECYNIIQKNEYKYLGFSVLLNFELTKELIAKLRRSGCCQHFMLGGVYATTNYSSILMHNQKLGIDSIIIGEGEETIVELIKTLEENGDWRSIESIAYIEKGIVYTNQRRRRISDLDLLPFQATDDIITCLGKNMPISIYTSRGCPGTCLYCGSNNLLNDKNNTWICRSAENVIEEIRQLVKKYNVKNISFVDDNFIGTLNDGIERTLKICKYIIDEEIDIRFFIECRPDALNNEVAEALQKAGCRSAFIGIESASEERLKEMGRGTITNIINQKAIDILNKYQIEPMIGFMMFTPDTTMSDIYLNLDFFEKFVLNRYIGSQKTQGIMSLLFSELLAISGTLIRRKLEKQGRIIEKNASYLISDDSVWLLRMIIKEHDLDIFMVSLERKIRGNWIHINEDDYFNEIKSIRFYECEMVLRSIKLLRFIIECIENHNLYTVTKEIIDFKKELINFANSTIKFINKILQKG